MVDHTKQLALRLLNHARTTLIELGWCKTAYAIDAQGRGVPVESATVAAVCMIGALDRAYTVLEWELVNRIDLIMPGLKDEITTRLFKAYTYAHTALAERTTLVLLASNNVLLDNASPLFVYNDAQSDKAPIVEIYNLVIAHLEIGLNQTEVL